MTDEISGFTALGDVAAMILVFGTIGSAVAGLIGAAVAKLVP